MERIFDLRFALVTSSGEKLFPFKKHEKARNLTGFAVSNSSVGSRYQQGIYVDNIEEVVHKVVNQNYKLMVQRLDKSKKAGTYKLKDGRTVVGFETDSSLKHLIKNNHHLLLN
jgi:hypothetical protein